MDKKQESSFLTYTRQTLPPAQLFVGQQGTTLKATEQLLQIMFCTNNSCNTCIPCMQIREKQHHAIMWLHPEKNYTIDQLDDLFSTLSLQLQPDEHFFFILQKADFLTPACANKLLKPMEEPPTGYHFVLLAEHAEQILPTIKSRCTIHTLSSETIQQTSHPLVEVFTKKMVASNEFSKILDTTTIHERETMELLDDIISHWLREYQQQKKEHVCSLITKLQRASLQPPMPGSSVAFWRNLYLQAHNDYF